MSSRQPSGSRLLRPDSYWILAVNLWAVKAVCTFCKLYIKFWPVAFSIFT